MSRAGRNGLTEKDKLRVLEMKSLGMSNAAIAKIFYCSVNPIIKVINDNKEKQCKNQDSLISQQKTEVKSQQILTR